MPSLDLARPHWDCIHFGRGSEGSSFCQQAEAAGLLLATVSLEGAGDGRALIGRVAAALPFPLTFWASWDGLADGWRDLRARVDQRGVALLLADARPLWAAQPETFGLFIELWLAAAGVWARDTGNDRWSHGRPFHLFIQW